MTYTKELPNSPEAEEALIAAVLIRPDLYITLDVEPQDFFQVRHKQLWQVFGELDAIDYVTVTERIKAKGQVDSVGGPQYLTGLLSRNVSTYNAEEYAVTVRGYARRRGMILLANEIVTSAFDTGIDIEAATPQFITKIVDASRVNAGAVHVGEIMSRLYDETEERSRNPRDIWGIPSGFSRFDRVTGGIQKGESMILSGEPGVGKSIMGMQLGLQLANKAPGAIYSMEMGAMQLARRMVSGIAKVNTRNIKTGRLQDNDWTKITSAFEHIEKKQVFISDGAGWTTTSLRADLARLQALHKIEWFVVDYLYLLNDGAGKDEIERTALASKGLKQICNELQLAGIVIHSMNKSQMGMDGKPGNQSLRGSGQVIYDADLITYLTKFKPMDLKDEMIPQPEQENMRTLWFGKGRELEDHRKYIHFVKQTGYPLFGEMEQHP